MTHFLDEFPLDWTDPALQELWSALARTYWNLKDIVAIAQDTGIQPGQLDLTGATDQVWRGVLTVARQKDLLRPLVGTAADRDAALKPKLDELRAAQPVTAAPGPPPEQDDWTGFDPSGQNERIIVAGFPSLLGIAFLEQGLRLAASVCRFNTVFDDERHYGSGFRIGADLLLTNHHVLHHWKRGDLRATGVDVWFNYELDWDLKFREHRAIACDPTTVVGEKAHDWAVVRTTEPIPDEFPVLSLDNLGDPPATNDRVYIIQHPNGEPKMIGMDHNLVRAVDTDVIQYWTDTEPGSSGSPVFDERWRPVGLHHRSIKIERPGESPEYRNQGRRLSTVVERMAALGVVR